MEPKILNNNILISSTTYFENTAKAVPPSTSSPNGKIVVVAGEPRDKVKIFHRSIYDSSGNIDTNIQTGEQPFPLGSPTRAVGTDNQIVRLKDGSLLAHKDSFVWDDIPSNPPAWFSEIVDGGGGMQKGQRGCLLFARSTDGGNSWKFHSVVDFATFLDGKYGYPQRHSNYPAIKYWIGGQDRTELYACPFTGFIYLISSPLASDL